MPKKHQPNFKTTPSNYVHPSLGGSSSNSSRPTTPPQTRTVNERLNQLRREQAAKAHPERRHEISAVVTQRTVPPALRHILNIPETAPPAPKPGTRVRGRRGPPGPAAPRSWLQSSTHAPEHVKRSAKAGDGSWKPYRFSLLAALEDAPQVSGTHSFGLYWYANADSIYSACLLGAACCTRH